MTIQQQNLITASDLTNSQNSQISIVPIGTILAWHKTLIGQEAPDGWVECNGQTLDDVHSPLYGKVIPDLNGKLDGKKRFLRGGTTSGSLEDDAFQGHFHSFNYPPNPMSTHGAQGADNQYRNLVVPNNEIKVTEPITDSINGTPRIADETRPVNMSVVYIIKVRESSEPTNQALLNRIQQLEKKPTWTDVTTLESGWQLHPNQLAYTKDFMGFVHLRGLVKGKTEGTIFHLPSGYVPEQQHLCVIASHLHNYGELVINTSGEVAVNNVRTEWMSLDNVNFYAG